MRSIKSGDILTVWRLDRLGRSLPHLIEVVRYLEGQGAGFQSLSNNYYGPKPVFDRSGAFKTRLHHKSLSCSVLFACSFQPLPYTKGIMTSSTMCGDGIECRKQVFIVYRRRWFLGTAGNISQLVSRFVHFLSHSAQFFWHKLPNTLSLALCV
ncbi:MAG: recombinase family protein [Lentisphaerae bacterium]|nr:recombinase family protein [Lentisphaerota bacterium]